MHLNKMMIIGFAGKDTKTSAIANGKVMTRLSIATTKRCRDSKHEWKSATQWHDVVIHGKAGNFAGKKASSPIVNTSEPSKPNQGL